MEINVSPFFLSPNNLCFKKNKIINLFYTYTIAYIIFMYKLKIYILCKKLCTY